MVAKSRERSEAHTLLIIRERSERTSLFYVLRSLLRVGTLRAQYSECVPSHSFTPQRVSGRWNPNARNERTLTERSGDDGPKGLLSKERANTWARRGLFISMGERAYTKRAAKQLAALFAYTLCERVFLVYSLSQLVLSMRR